MRKRLIHHRELMSSIATLHILILVAIEEEAELSRGIDASPYCPLRLSLTGAQQGAHAWRRPATP